MYDFFYYRLINYKYKDKQWLKGLVWSDFTVFFPSVHVEDYFFDATRHIYFFHDVTGHASSSCHIECPLLICVRDMFFCVWISCYFGFVVSFYYISWIDAARFCVWYSINELFILALCVTWVALLVINNFESSVGLNIGIYSCRKQCTVTKCTLSLFI